MIAFSPSSVIWQGIPNNRWDLGKDPRSSWSYQGKAIPYLSYLTPISKWEILTLQLRNLHEMSLRANANDEDPTIQLDTLHAALLLISGRRDRLWPSTPMAEQIVRSLKENGFGLPYEHIAMDSGHNSLVMNRDVWRRVFSFLEDNFCEDATLSPANGLELCKDRR